MVEGKHNEWDMKEVKRENGIIQTQKQTWHLLTY